MVLPNYKNGSIVNLANTLIKAFDGKPEYGLLAGLDPEIFRGKNVVLLVIDGLGYKFLRKHGQGSFLEKNISKKITSVFPPSTTTAVTALTTGLAPMQHGLTAWFMYYRELGMIVKTLPFITRSGKIPLADFGVKMKKIFNEKSLFRKVKAVSYVIQDKSYIDSDYSRIISEGAKRIGYSSLDGFFRAVKTALKEKTKRKFVYAYWGMLDYYAHRKGVKSRTAVRHFREIDKKVKALAENLKGSNTVLIITADHGLIDTKDKIIKLSGHPKLLETLALPLVGEPRTAYCYVRPEKVKQFESYVKKYLKKYCTMRKSKDLIKKGYFGPGKANPKIFDRVGDYILIMKGNYVIRDYIEGEDHSVFIGNHGGTSPEEMYVPLIIFASKSNKSNKRGQLLS